MTTHRNVANILLVAFLVCLSSCGGQPAIVKSKESIAKSKPSPQSIPFKYSLHLATSGSLSTPQDDFFMDTTSEYSFRTDQKMSDGTWKSPFGLGYLDPPEEDSLLRFVQNPLLYSIDENDVTPQCPEGDQYALKLYRTDTKQVLFIHTNTCSIEYNLLYGPKRKLFSQFIGYLEFLRKKYRPAFTE
ncbi:MAG: hypothetical protein WCH46_07015 [bacterium]